ncbi:unnamed protein product [Rhodiola kirilowii]
MAVWLSFIFLHLLISSYVSQCSVSQPENADCEFPQFGAPPVPQTPSLLNSPVDPWTPGDIIPHWSPLIPWMPRQMTPPGSKTPLLPQMPKQLIPPPLARPKQSKAPLLPPKARQPSPPPFIPEKSNAPFLHGMPGELIPPPMAPAQPNTHFLPRKPRDIISSPLAPGESSTGSLPETPPQSGSSSSFTSTQLQLPFLFQTRSSSSSKRAKAVGTAVGVTLAITVIVAGVSICLILKCCKSRRRECQISGLAGGTSPVPGAGGKNLKGLIVDEKGQDMVYWRKDNEGDDKARNSFSTEKYDLYKERIKTKENEKDDIPFIGGKSSASQQPATPILKVNQPPEYQSAGVRFEAALDPRLPPLWPSGRKGLGKQTDGKENLQPVRREEVNINVDHSTIWGKNNGGSLSYDGDLMEAMFGSVATKRRTPKRAEDKTPATPISVNWRSSQIFLLDPRRSQNIASILKSVKVSRQELLLALNEGKGLNADILEKLSKISPTKREESLILAFRGHPPNLAHAESFLYHTMKSVPLAFPRLNAMHFRSNYPTEIQFLDEHVHTLEKGCYELKESGLLLKLITAALKAGHDMNAGDVSGAARPFNLTSLWKLFNVQSLDGKSTIIQSVVEEVAISEGKQCVLDRDNRLNLSRRNIDSSSSLSKQNSKKFMILGLPLVSSLSAGFPNVKKTAAIDYYTYFFTASSNLAAGLMDIQHTVRECNSTSGSDGGFVTELTAFLEAAREELREKTEDQMRVIRLVKRTTEYYQSGVSPNEDASSFQLFATVKEFLDIVDQACLHLSENLQRRKTLEADTGSVLAEGTTNMRPC